MENHSATHHTVPSETPGSTSWRCSASRAVERWATRLFLLLVIGQEIAPQAPVREARSGVAAPGMPDDWLAGVTATIRQGEYSYARAAEEAWSAPNRSQELRSRISRVGLQVFPRATDASGAGSAWMLGLTTTRFGREGKPWALECRAIRVAGARAELDHGALGEWLENTPRGIEQGWTITQRLAGIDALEIGLLVGGDLELCIAADGRSGVFVNGRGEARIAYGHLRAWDAAGCELEARLEPRSDGVVIRIDDARAAYPITIDPLLTSPSWTAEPDQESALFGASVSAAGDVNRDGYPDVIVGAPRYDNGQVDEGRAYVFHGSPSGLTATPAWVAESDQASASFGFSVATAGDVNGDGYSDVIVGAPDHENGEAGEGRAYVFHGSPSGLAATAAWTAESDQAFACFGFSVATAGDVDGDGHSDVVVGAPRYDDGQTDEGRAHVYLGSSSGLDASPAWTSGSDQAEAWLGSSVSTAGDVNGDGYSDVLVGARGFDDGETDEGRVLLYLGSPGGLTSSPAWTAQPDRALALMGSSVSAAGDVNGDGLADVLVGVPGFDDGLAGEGRAELYLGASLGLAASPAWSAQSGQVGARMGCSVSTAGDVNGDGYSDVIVGAQAHDDGEADEGCAFLFLGSGDGLAASAAWTAGADQESAALGSSVAAAGDVDGDGYSDVIVGASAFDDGELDEGQARLYRGSASGLAASPGWTAEAEQAFAELGTAASAGDVNGDGYGDVIVGVWLYDDGESNEGAAFVYLGSASGLAPSPAWTAESNQASAFLGLSVQAAGDVNGDGYSDVIVGAHGYANGEASEGRAFVYHGSASGLAANPAWTAESDQVLAHFGGRVASAGDVNGDGYSDVLVGADGFDHGETDEGRAYLYLGSRNGLAPSPAWITESNQEFANLGRVASAGDVNGDGYSDVIVGTGLFDDGESDEGGAFVYHGSAGGLATSPAWTAESDQENAFFGHSIGSAGDVNGDGFSDVIVGAGNFGNGESGEGRAYVYQGSPEGLAASPGWTAESDLEFTGFGHAVGTAGDVNGDGYSDVIVGAPFFDNGATNEGRAYVYLGSASGVAPSPAWTVESDQALAYLGDAVATAGDVNGDGYSDVLVVASGFDNGQLNEGRAFVYLGNDGAGGLVRVLQQRDRRDLRPISLLGRTAPDGLFHIRAEFPRNPAGFDWSSPAEPVARLEWEVKPLGVAFDGSRIQVGALQPLQPAGGTLIFGELAVADDDVPHARCTDARSYHWRARIATNSPLFPRTSWFGVPGNNVNEAKLRRPPTGME